MSYMILDAMEHVYHCTKCGAESHAQFIFHLAGHGRVCHACFQKGNKDSGRIKRAKEIQKAVAARICRREIEGRGLERFA